MRMRCSYRFPVALLEQFDDTFFFPCTLANRCFSFLDPDRLRTGLLPFFVGEAFKKSVKLFLPTVSTFACIDCSGELPDFPLVLMFRPSVARSVTSSLDLLFFAPLGRKTFLDASSSTIKS